MQNKNFGLRKILEHKVFDNKLYLFLFSSITHPFPIQNAFMNTFENIIPLGMAQHDLNYTKNQ